MFNLKKDEIINDIEKILVEFSNEKFIIVRDGSKMDNQHPYITEPNVFTITQLGIEQSKLIDNPYVVECIPEMKIKDLIVLDLIIKKISPFGIINLNSEWYHFFSDILSQRKAQLTDTYSKNRILMLLNKKGFTKQIDEKNYKFNKRGKKLIEIGTLNKFIQWEKEQEANELERRKLSDVLLKGSVSTLSINKRLLWINRWIALATVAAAIYYLFQMFDYYQIHFLNYNYLSYLVTGLILGAILSLAIKPLWELLRKKSTDDSVTK